MLTKSRMLVILAAAATLGSGCARYSDSAAGSVIDPAEAAKTVVLHVNNQSSESMELHAINEASEATAAKLKKEIRIRRE